MASDEHCGKFFEVDSRSYEGLSCSNIFRRCIFPMKIV